MGFHCYIRKVSLVIDSAEMLTSRIAFHEESTGARKAGYGVYSALLFLKKSSDKSRSYILDEQADSRTQTSASA